MKRIPAIAVSILLIFVAAGCRPRPQVAQDESPDMREWLFRDRGDSETGEPSAGEDPAEPPAETDAEDVGLIDFLKYGGTFELPLAGATGFAGTAIPLLLSPNGKSTVLRNLRPGQGFTILEESAGWWRVDTGAGTGWVSSAHCLINLPDVIPSMIYDNTNTYSSLFRSSGVEIPNVTGVALYRARDFNFRLGREEYIMPVLYGMAGRISAAQQAALADGNTIIIYEAFRPHAAHQIVFDNFLWLIENDPVVHDGVTSGWFTVNWFLAPSPYNHQRGTAVDASLARVIATETRASGDFSYIHVSEYEEFPMQTAMHELSGAAAVFARPVSSRSETEWRSARLSKSATEGTVLMMKYMTDQGLTPLASEWWHFNDLPGTAAAVEMGIVGRFQTERSFSRQVVVER